MRARDENSSRFVPTVYYYYAEAVLKKRTLLSTIHQHLTWFAVPLYNRAGTLLLIDDL